MFWLAPSSIVADRVASGGKGGLHQLEHGRTRVAGCRVEDSSEPPSTQSWPHWHWQRRWPPRCSHLSSHHYAAIWLSRGRWRGGRRWWRYAVVGKLYRLRDPWGGVGHHDAGAAAIRAHAAGAGSFAHTRRLHLGQHADCRECAVAPGAVGGRGDAAECPAGGGAGKAGQVDRIASRVMYPASRRRGAGRAGRWRRRNWRLEVGGLDCRHVGREGRGHAWSLQTGMQPSRMWPRHSGCYALDTRQADHRALIGKQTPLAHPSRRAPP